LAEDEAFDGFGTEAWQHDGVSDAGADFFVHGPALVRLAFPFRVERLPSDESNYLRDLRFARVQFDLPLA
jgi:hypothetical protein